MQAFWVSLVSCFSICGCILNLMTKGKPSMRTAFHVPNLPEMWTTNSGHPDGACASPHIRISVAAKCRGTCATGAGHAPCAWWRIDIVGVSYAWPGATGPAGSARCCSRVCSVPAGKDRPVVGRSSAVAARSFPLFWPVCMNTLKKVLLIGRGGGGEETYASLELLS